MGRRQQAELVKQPPHALLPPATHPPPGKRVPRSTHAPGARSCQSHCSRSASLGAAGRSALGRQHQLPLAWLSQKGFAKSMEKRQHEEINFFPPFHFFVFGFLHNMCSKRAESCLSYACPPWPIDAAHQHWWGRRPFHRVDRIIKWFGFKGTLKII